MFPIVSATEIAIPECLVWFVAMILLATVPCTWLLSTILINIGRALHPVDVAALMEGIVAFQPSNTSFEQPIGHYNVQSGISEEFQTNCAIAISIVYFGVFVYLVCLVPTSSQSSFNRARPDALGGFAIILFAFYFCNLMYMIALLHIRFQGIAILNRDTQWYTHRDHVQWTSEAMGRLILETIPINALFSPYIDSMLGTIMCVMIACVLTGSYLVAKRRELEIILRQQQYAHEAVIV